MKRVTGTHPSTRSTPGDESGGFPDADLLVLPPESDEPEPWVTELERMMVSVGSRAPGAPEVGDSHALRAQIEAVSEDRWFEEWLLADGSDVEAEAISPRALVAPVVVGGLVLAMMTAVVWPF